MDSADAPFAALRPLVQPPPRFAPEEVLVALGKAYGLEGRLRPLVSERDQNFRLVVPGGERFVVKIANAAEPPAETDFQAHALLHIAARGCSVALPELVLARGGLATVPIGDAPGTHRLRVVTWVPGRPAGEFPLTIGLAAGMGAALARIDRALEGFRHPAESRPLIWDVQRTPELRSLLVHMRDAGVAARLAAVIDDFEALVAPRIAGLRSQVIHGDYHTENILVDGDGAELVGVIDFGDMLRAPLVVDVAVAASYQRTTGGDRLALIAGLVAAYHAVNPLDREEASLLYDLVRARLCTTITVLNWRAATRGQEDSYLQAALASENGAPAFLAAIERVGRRDFTDRMLAACEAGQGGRAGSDPAK